MICGLLRPLRYSFLYLLSILLYTSAPAQEVQHSKAIDLDRELEVQLPPDRAASYYHYALAKWNEDQGDLAKALLEMQTSLRYNQSSPAVHLALADLLEKDGRIREAIEHAQDASRLDPKDPDPHWALALIYLKPQARDASQSENVQKAVQELEKLKELTPEDERAYFYLGSAYFDLNQPEKAIEAFEKYQSLAESSDNGYKEIAKYYGRAGNDQKAIEYLAKAVKAQPDSTESLMMLASLYSKLNKDKEAVPLYRKLLELTGNNADVNRRLALSLLEIGEFKEAANILNELVKNSPRDIALQILQGRCRVGLRQFAEAIETFKSILAANPNIPDAQFYLGWAYKESGAYAEAVKAFSHLLEQTAGDSEEAKSDRVTIQQNLAESYQEMGDHEKAIALYEEMVKTDNNKNPKLMFLLINAYRISRRFDKALPLGKQQYEKNSGDTNMGVVYAQTLTDAGKTREATEVLLKLLQTDPSNINLYVNLSQAYLQEKRYSDAEKVIRRAEDKKLDDERLKIQLAAIYERQKDFDRAESLIKEILRLNPDSAVALNYIGYMLADRGIRLDEALRYVKEALVIDPNNGAYLDSLGWAFFKLNDLGNAEKYLLQAHELIKSDPVVEDHLGELYFRTGDYQKAHDFWMKSVSIGTEPDDIQSVRRKLEMVREKLRKKKAGK